MKLSEENKELLFSLILTFLGLSMVIGLFFGLIHVIGNIILKALEIIFNRN